MQALVREAAEELGIETVSLPSRAMHDASWMAMIAPVAMVFVPSKDGLSHTPDEWTDFADVAAGARVLGKALLKLDARE
jgi:N-carbamoyl-L-amino-acid hydrolase